MAPTFRNAEVFFFLPVSLARYRNLFPSPPAKRSRLFPCLLSGRRLRTGWVFQSLCLSSCSFFVPPCLDRKFFLLCQVTLSSVRPERRLDSLTSVYSHHLVCAHMVSLHSLCVTSDQLASSSRERHSVVFIQLVTGSFPLLVPRHIGSQSSGVWREHWDFAAFSTRVPGITGFFFLRGVGWTYHSRSVAEVSQNTSPPVL